MHKRGITGEETQTSRILCQPIARKTMTRFFCNRGDCEECNFFIIRPYRVVMMRNQTNEHRLSRCGCNVTKVKAN